MWDTHAQNADRLQDCLCPQFDVTFVALLDDLEQRGLLDETLVVAIGEFGRTPRINGSEDASWGHVYFAMAGAGISGGQVSSAPAIATALHPLDNPLRPHDLVATIFYLRASDPGDVFYDKNNPPAHPDARRTVAPPARNGPATLERCPSGGDPAFRAAVRIRGLLLDTDFQSPTLIPATPPSDNAAGVHRRKAMSFAVRLTE